MNIYSHSIRIYGNALPYIGRVVLAIRQGSIDEKKTTATASKAHRR